MRLVTFCIRVKILEFNSRCLIAKLPVYGCRITVIILIPCFKFFSKSINIRDPAVEALLSHDVYPYFCDIKPAAVLWSIVDLNLSCESSCFLRRKSLIQRCNVVRIQIIHDKNNLLSIRIYLINKVLNLFCPINCCSWRFNCMNNSSCMRLNKTEYANGAISLVFIINFSDISWPHW